MGWHIYCRRAGSRTITINGQGEQYNVETGDGSGTATGIAFAADGEHVALAETAGNITVDAAGRRIYRPTESV